MCLPPPFLYVSYVFLCLVNILYWDIKIELLLVIHALYKLITHVRAMCYDKDLYDLTHSSTMYLCIKRIFSSRFKSFILLS